MAQRASSQAAARPASAQSGDRAELDNLDLLGGKRPSVSVPDADILATAAAFNTRIQRRKREQERALTAAEQAARVRHALMVKALVSIRKSLREVTRIDLGERFHFALSMDDWGGWPRITVRLNDALLPQADYPHLRVTAHDRQARAQIEVEYDAEQPTEVLSLTSEAELKRLPATLKKCVRSFLDMMGDIVLEAERTGDTSADEAEIQSSSIDADVLAAQTSLGVTHDLFEEESYEENFLETLPQLEQIEALRADLLEVGETQKKKPDPR